MALGLTLLLLTLPRQTTLRLPRQIAQRVRAILRLGLPIGGLIALEVGVFAVAGILMGLFGADALAAHQLALNVASLTFMIPLGIGQAATVRVAFELGASAPRVAHRAGVVALLVGVIIMMACGLLIWMAPRAIAGVYLDLQDPANHVTSVIVLEFLTVAAVFQVFDGIQVIAAGALRGHRDTAVPLLIAAFGYWGIGFTGGWLLAFPLSCGPIGLWFGLAGGLAVVRWPAYASVADPVSYRCAQGNRTGCLRPGAHNDAASSSGLRSCSRKMTASRIEGPLPTPSRKPTLVVPSYLVSCQNVIRVNRSVDGTLLEAWASSKSFRAKDGSGEPPGLGRNGERDFHGERRTNDTHASTTDPDARLFRKGPGKEARLCFMGHALMENRNGLIVGAVTTRASGHAERLAADRALRRAAAAGHTRRRQGLRRR